MRTLGTLSARWHVLTLGLLLVPLSLGQAEPPARLDLHGDPLPDGVLVRLGTTRWRHGGAGAAIAYSTDGKTLVSGGWHGTLRFWNVTSGKELRRIPIREKTVKAIAFSPDGTKVAAAGAQGRVCVVDLAAGKEVVSFHWATSALLALAFSPDSKLVASAGKGGVISILDVTAGRGVKALQGHESDITGLAFTPDGKALASASLDQTIRIWETTAWRELFRIREEQMEYHAVAFSPDGTVLAAGGEKDDADIGRLEGRLVLYDLAALRLRLKQPTPDAKRLKELVTLLDDKKFDVRQKAALELAGWGEIAEKALQQALADKPPLEVARRIEDLLEKLKQGPPSPGEARHTFKTGDRCVEALAFTRDGDSIAAGDRGGIRFWNAKTGKEQLRLTCPLGDVEALAFSPDKRTLAFTAGPSLIALASLSAGAEPCWEFKIKPAEEPGHVFEIGGISFSPDGKFLASFGVGDTSLRLWDTANGKQLRLIDAQGTAVSGVSFSADGKILSAGGEKDRLLSIHVWDTDKYAELRTIQSLEPRWLYGVQFSPDGKIAAGVHCPEAPTDGFIHRWDLTTGKKLDKSAGCGPAAIFWRAINSPPVLFPDGRTIAAAQQGKTVRIHNAADERDIHTLESPAEVWKVVVSPNGKLLATNAEWANQRESNLRIWDAATGKELYRLEQPLGQAAAMAFSADGRLLACTGQDGAIRLWEMATGQLLRQLKGNSPITCLLFSPDGKRLASGGADTAVLIWKVEAEK
jgi:WD40 repeat protein